MNNKGQTLVLFLFLLPIILIISLAIYQIATLGLEKRKIIDSINVALEYGVYNLNSNDLEEKLIEMILTENPNINEQNIEIIKSNYQIEIIITKQYQIAFIIEDELNISYVGKLVDGNLEIIKNRG